jgi:hypothetical protein
MQLAICVIVRGIWRSINTRSTYGDGFHKALKLPERNMSNTRPCRSDGERESKLLEDIASATAIVTAKYERGPVTEK